jgi:rubrerythrin
MLEARQQAKESQDHAEHFKMILEKAQKRFSALKKVEERHANAYKKVLEAL